MKDLASALAALRAQHQYRTRAVVDSPQGTEIVVDGTRYLSFCSNDYLGLARHSAVVAALKAGADKYGAGSGASHLVTGTQRPHHALEGALEEFTRSPRALLFSTGVMADLGVVGATGRGCIEHFGLSGDAVPILIGTLGKAFGTFGAFGAGSEDLIEYLIQRARPYIYTTALPPAVAHATLTSLRLACEEDWRRVHLRTLITRFRCGAEQWGAKVMDSTTPIQPLLVGDAERALALSAALRERGIYITAIRPPTVPAGTARLRITFSAAHGEAEVDRLLDALEAVL